MEPHIPDPELPPPGEYLFALGHLARVIELRLPGVLDEWVDSIENGVLMTEIVRLRGPRTEPTLRVVAVRALAWAKHVRLVTLAHLGAERQRRKRG